MTHTFRDLGIKELKRDPKETQKRLKRDPKETQERLKRDSTEVRDSKETEKLKRVCVGVKLVLRTS